VSRGLIAERYLARAILHPVLLVLALLVALNLVYLFIEEQSTIGQGAYTLPHALRYVFLNVPQIAFDFAPAGVLVGAMLGLGDLARRSEIIALRAAGFSVARLVMTLVSVGVLFTSVTFCLGEFFAAPTLALARQGRAEARSAGEATLEGARSWVRSGRTYLRLETPGMPGSSQRVATFEVSADATHLVSIGHAENIAVDSHGRWRLLDFRQVQYAADGVHEVAMPAATVSIRSGAALLDAGTQAGDRSVRELARLIREFVAGHRDVRPLRYALASRLARPASIVFCVLLALPFALGNLRAARPSVRILLAIGIGLVFTLVQQLLESGVVLSQISPTALAWLPTLLLGAMTSLLLIRIR
jgi:lipopolysaccharide export system permease protein